MTLLIVADIHGCTSCLEVITDRIAKVDIVLIAGDITEFGNAPEANEILKIFEKHQAVIAAVPGNCDRSGARILLEQRGISADGRVLKLEKALVAGAGGGNWRTGLTPYERKDEELSEAIESAVHQAERAIRDGELGKPLILLSHTPPFGTKADVRAGRHVGSPALRSMLDSLRPLLWVSGHIHEARSISRSGNTLIINPGPLREGKFASAQINGNCDRWQVEAELSSG